MNTDYLPNRPAQPQSNSNFKPGKVIAQELLNQGKLIIKGHGLNALKASLYQLGNLEQLEKENEARAEGNFNKALSSFGLPVFDVLTFADKTYETLDKEQIDVVEFNMGIALIEVTQTKNIVKTPVQGRPGTVKEFISAGDYMVTIRGVLSVNAMDVFPEEAVVQLREFFEVPESIQVGSSFLQLLNITDLVLETISISQTEGMRNVVRFTLEGLSDYPFEIKTQKV